MTGLTAHQQLANQAQIEDAQAQVEDAQGESVSIFEPSQYEKNIKTLSKGGHQFFRRCSFPSPEHLRHLRVNALSILSIFDGRHVPSPSSLTIRIKWSVFLSDDA